MASVTLFHPREDVILVVLRQRVVEEFEEFPEGRVGGLLVPGGAEREVDVPG